MGRGISVSHYAVFWSVKGWALSQNIFHFSLSPNVHFSFCSTMKLNRYENLTSCDFPQLQSHSRNSLLWVLIEYRPRSPLKALCALKNNQYVWTWDIKSAMHMPQIWIATHLSFFHAFVLHQCTVNDFSLACSQIATGWWVYDPLVMNVGWELMVVVEVNGR